MITSDKLEKIKFTNLVQHSHWTIPLGIGGVKKQIQGTVKKGLTGFAITDHLVMSGVLEVNMLGKDKEFAEKLKIDKLYTMMGVRLNFTDDLDNKDPSRLFQLTLFAKNKEGYRNLTYLTSISSDEEHYFETKRLGLYELLENSNGVMIGSGGINGILGQAIARGTGQEEDLAQIFKENFGDNFYIEIHYRPQNKTWDAGTKQYVATNEDIQKKVNLRLIELSKQFDIKCCLVQNSYMVEEKHFPLQNILIGNHPDYKKSGWIMDQAYYLQSVEEMYEYIQKHSPYITDGQFEEFCANTQYVLNECKGVTLEFSPALPAIKYDEHPTNNAEYEQKLADLREKMVGFSDLMVHLIDKSEHDISLRTTIKSIIRLGKMQWENKKYVDLLAFELKVMQRNGVIRLCDYFLLLEDVTNFVRDNGYLRGFGRGSGGGSLLTYMMDISDVDSLQYELLFERFLTKERIGTYFFDVPNYPNKIASKVEDLSNPAYEKIVSLMDEKRVKESNSEYLEKELFYLECNPNIAEYVLSVYDDLKSKNEKIQNLNSSTVSYVLGMSDVLPKSLVDHTPTTLPDFDYDTDGRDQVKQYLVSKYGKNHVTLLGTVGTLKTKGAIKDILRQLRPYMGFEEVNELTKKFNLLKPTDYKVEMEFFQASLEADKSLKDWFEKNDDVLDALKMLLGNAKTTGVHAGGIVVSRVNVIEIMAMTWDLSEKIWVTQAEMGYVEKAGLVKYDFLGLKTLGDLNRVLRLVNSRHGKNFNLSNIPMHDKEVLHMFVEGKTESIFQFNTNLATSILTQLKEVRSVSDLAMITSIARPGPLDMGMDKVFIKRNTGEDPVEFLHPMLKPILSETYGILCYQESLIQVAQRIGSMNGDDSVSFMKALSKKQLEKVVKYRDKFVKSAVEKYHFKQKDADDLFDLCEAFAAYGFNKSHAVAYGAVSYLSMWFKRYYPAEWYSAVLTGAEKEDFKLLYPRWKDSITRPDVNLSRDTFVIDKDNMVVMPLNAINGVGIKAVENIVKNQPYSSFADFFSKIDKRQVNKSTTVNLIFSGSFDSMKTDPAMSENRWRKLMILEFLKLKYSLKKPSKAEKEADDLFLKEVAGMNRGAMLMKEISLLNFTAFDYFEYYRDKMTDGARQKFGYEAVTPGKVEEFPNDSTVIIGGAVESIEIAPVKNPKSKIFGKEMCRIKISNAGESIDVVLFPRALEDDDKAGGMIRKLQEYTPIVIKGKVNRFNGQLSVVYDAGWILL